jgi:branched-chain amino acid transport system permease protein
MRNEKPYIGIAMLVVAALCVWPLTDFDARTYLLQVAIFLFMHIILAQSYDLVAGYMGYINLGHIAFFGLGAYSFGILFNAGLPTWGVLLLVATAGVGFAALLSVPFFRLRGAYFSLAAFGLVKLMEYLTNNLGWLTGGSNGLKIAPANRTVTVYYLSLLLVLAVILTSWVISRSRLGLAMQSIREDEDVARDFGVPTRRIKSQALMISSIFPALMGGLYTYTLNFIDAEQVYGLRIALTPIAMAMLGGSGLLMGPIIGVVFLYTAEELIWTNFEHLHGAILGLVIVLVGLFMPGGLARLPVVAGIVHRLGLAEEDA